MKSTCRGVQRVHIKAAYVDETKGVRAQKCRMVLMKGELRLDELETVQRQEVGKWSKGRKIEVKKQLKGELESVRKMVINLYEEVSEGKKKNEVLRIKHEHLEKREVKEFKRMMKIFKDSVTCAQKENKSVDGEESEMEMSTALQENEKGWKRKMKRLRE